MKQGQAIDVMTEAFESSIVHTDRLDQLHEYVSNAKPADVLSALQVAINFALDERKRAVPIAK